MSELEEKLSQVLNNPQMMQQIMSLAQSMGSATPQSEPTPERKPEHAAVPERRQEPAAVPASADLGLIQKVAGMASNTGVDANQRALLKALGPYVSRNRVRKLEKAMRAAKMAVFASSLFQAPNER